MATAATYILLLSKIESTTAYSFMVWFHCPRTPQEQIVGTPAIVVDAASDPPPSGRPLTSGRPYSFAIPLTYSKNRMPSSVVSKTSSLFRKAYLVEVPSM